MIIIIIIHSVIFIFTGRKVQTRSTSSGRIRNPKKIGKQEANILIKDLLRRYKKWACVLCLI